MSSPRQVFAFAGLCADDDVILGATRLVGHALSLVDPARRVGRPVRVGYLPTAVGDRPDVVRDTQELFVRQWPDVDLSVLTLFPRPGVADVRTHLLAQDLVLVEGGSVVNLLAVWRAHHLPRVLRECWESGVVLAGPGAGGLCWHAGGVTDALGDALEPFTDGLGLLPCTHAGQDDTGDRRRVYRELVAAGAVAAGYAAEAGVGLHYVGETLHEAVTLRPEGAAWWVEPAPGGGWREHRVPTRTL